MNRAIRDAKTVLEWVAEGHASESATRTVMESCAAAVLKQEPFARRKPPKKSLPFPRRKDANKAKREERREKVSGIRAEVFERAGGLCELCRTFPPTELHHLESGPDRRRLESVQNCLAACSLCHRVYHLQPGTFRQEVEDWCEMWSYPIPRRFR